MTEKEIRLVEENVPLAGYVAKRWVKQAGIEWEDARKNFKRQPYKSVDVAQYMAKKFGIGGDADGRRTENHE